VTDPTPAAGLVKRGRPRSERSRAAILDAAAELLLGRGLGGVSMDDVAAAAGVSKATIYRWWPRKESLALDALYRDWAVGCDAALDTGSLGGDLLALLRPWYALLTRRPYARVIGALITEAQSDPAFAREYLARFVEPRRARALAIFERAIGRGEVGLAVPVDVTLDLLYGAIYHRLLHGHAPLSERFLEQVIDTVLVGVTPRAGGPTAVPR